MLDAKKIKENLTLDQIVKIMMSIGVDKYSLGTDYIIFPTVCHNPIGERASLKLYYYDNKKLFVCFTECDETFDIYNLILQIYKINNWTLEGGNNFFSALMFVVNFFNLESDHDFIRKQTYTVIRDKYKKQNYDIVLDEYDDIVLETYHNYLPVEWRKEGITDEIANKFNIRYYALKNEIIIPHYDVENRLVGIRSRRLENIDGGKYIPTTTHGRMYSHPLSFNLYGLAQNGAGIRKTRSAIIFEGEKSVLKLESLSPINYGVACCGSSINKFQINLLLKLGVSEIIIAFDKEFATYPSAEAEKYFNKLYKLAGKYCNYCNVSFIFDTKGLLQEKDSPVDRGEEVFNQLLSQRIYRKG